MRAILSGTNPEYKGVFRSGDVPGVQATATVWPVAIRVQRADSAPPESAHVPDVIVQGVTVVRGFAYRQASVPSS